MKRFLLVCLLLFVTVLSVLAPLVPGAVGTAHADTNSDAAALCKTVEPYNGKFPNGNPQSPVSNHLYDSCVAGYFQEVTAPTTNETQFCNTGGRDSTACASGWNAAKNKTQPGTPGSQAQATAAVVCTPFGGDKEAYCQQVLSAQCSKYAATQTTDVLNKKASDCFNGAYAKHTGASNTCGSNAACAYGYKNTKAPAAPAPASDTNKQLVCEIKGDSPLTWIICPVVDALVGIVGVIDNIITNQLDVKTGAIFCDSTPTCQAYYSAWQAFRDIALGLMVIAGLIIVIAQALGMELLDAYTIRKTLPRLLIAAISISLSWALMRFLIQLSDDVGFGIRQLIYAPFTHLGDSLNLDLGSGAANLFFGGLGFAGATVGGGGVLLLTLGGGIGALLGYAGTAALAVFVAITVLILRQIVIILMVLVSPIAIVAYILPNTQRIYRLWWDNFSKALMMFPLIAAMIASGRVFSAVSIHNGGAINQIIGFAAYFAPYFLIPLTFRMSGSMVGAMGNFVNQRAQGGFDGLRKFRANRRASGREKVQSMNTFRGAPKDSRKGRLNAAFGTVANFNPDHMSVNPRRWRSEAKAMREDAEWAHMQHAFSEASRLKTFNGDDDLAQAYLDGRTRDERREILRRKTRRGSDGIERRIYSDDEIEQKLSHLDLAERQVGRPALEGAAIMSAVQASTAYMGPNGGIGKLVSDIDHAADGNDQIRAQLIGQVKQLAQQAGRPDLVAPFSDMYVESKVVGQAANREAAIATSTARLHDVIVDTEGAGFLWGAKGAAAEQFLPAVQRRVERSAQALQIANQQLDRFTDPNLTEAQRQVWVDDGQGGQRQLTGEEIQAQAEQANRAYIDSLASTVALGDVANQVSDEKRRLFQAGILEQSMPGTNQTVAEAIKAVSNDPEFMKNRSFYEQQYRDAQARQLQLGQPPATDPNGAGGAGQP